MTKLYFRAVVPPIMTSVVYQHLGPDEHTGYQYSRYKNPTRDSLETCLAALDGAKYALAFSAGTGALSAILATLKGGDGIISTEYLYGGTIRLFRDLCSKHGIDTQYVDFTDLKAFEDSIKPNTKLVWVESPTSPVMTILDIKAIADIVHAKSGAFLVVDNSFMTPYFQRPLELGADVVMYSVTKFINGHNDVTMGSIATNNETLFKDIKYYQISTGVVPSPFDCYVVNRSLKTLALRMERHSENSFTVAEFLESHEKVEKVLHPSLKSHANHEVALEQSYGHSGILSFYIKGSLEQTKKFFKSLNLIMVTESLGGTESTCSFPYMMSHSDLPEKQRLSVGVTENLIRFSVGLEDVENLIADLDQALNQI